MKKTCVLITLTLILCLSACSKNSSQSKNDKSTSSNKTTASDVSESGSKYSQGDTVVVPNE